MSEAGALTPACVTTGRREGAQAAAVCEAGGKCLRAFRLWRQVWCLRHTYERLRSCVRLHFRAARRPLGADPRPSPAPPPGLLPASVRPIEMLGRTKKEKKEKKEGESKEESACSLRC